ncbi:MAG TPA: M28 family peptidase [Melioribacteraceae bacterium]|nr:M28 family peptidase [Melioribacteraceae bacterium]
MKSGYLTILLILIQQFLGFAQVRNSVIDPSQFSSSEFFRHVNFLGSDLLEGRGTGMNGGNLAARYLALEFNRIGLKPVGNDNTFYQNIPMHESRALPSSKLILHFNSTQSDLNLFDDYLLYQSGSQNFIPIPTPLVFVGYGIIAPEYDYNDYQSVDVEGKIVVFIDGEPYSEDEDFFQGSLPSVYSYAESKQRIAISRGARGSILIPEYGNDKKSFWEKLKKDFSFESISLAYSVSSNFSAIINYEAAVKLFNNSGYSIEEIRMMQAGNRIKSFPLSTSLSFKGHYQTRDFIAQNVIGMIEGNDPMLKDRYIIVTAHYDHLGIGPAVDGDSIYNGVFDNASGTAALLELASYFSRNSFLLRRSIVFLLLTGEESGLLGSRYYTDNPVFPLYKTVANVNIDGIASFDNFKSIIGIGKEYSTLKNFLENTANSLTLEITGIPPQFAYSESFSRSDQVSFANAGIPSILVSEGLDYANLSREEGFEKYLEYSKKYYHTPFDDLNQKINPDAAIQHITVLASLIIDLSQNEVEPEWNRGTPYLNIRLRSIAEKR